MQDSRRPPFMAQGSTVSATTAVVDYLRKDLVGTGVDQVQVVERHIGRFDKPEDLKRWMSGRDGGIRIAALGVPEFRRRGRAVIGTVAMAAYVFCTDYWGYSRDTRVEVITGRLAHLLMARGWARDVAESGVSNLSADNLYDTEIDQLGVTIWALSWMQEWQLDSTFDLSTLDDFKLLGLAIRQGDGEPVMRGNIEVETECQT